MYYLLVQPRRAAAGNFKSSSCVALPPRPRSPLTNVAIRRNRRLTEMAIYSVKTNMISAILQICVLVRAMGSAPRCPQY